MPPGCDCLAPPRPGKGARSEGRGRGADRRLGRRHPLGEPEAVAAAAPARPPHPLVRRTRSSAAPARPPSPPPAPPAPASRGWASLAPMEKAGARTVVATVSGA